MRVPIMTAVAVSFALLAGPPPALAAETCEGTSCGVPECWRDVVPLRPDMTRAATVPCRNALAARLKTPPAHSDVSNVSVDYYGLHFDGRPHAGAARWDEAVFEVDGPDGTIELRVRIEVVPRSENSPPRCWGDRVSQRSDGSGPVELFTHPSCWDPDGDEFVVEGGPPGVHRDSPKHVPAGSSEANWPYRTATFSGDEVAQIWATDSLGARSENAQLEITVGPDVDRLPKCHPSSWNPSAAIHTVYSRPGALRRFGLTCEDADGDLLVPRLSSPPERGVLPIFLPGPPSVSDYWGTQMPIDVLYAPPDQSLEPDRFELIASGTRGDGPVNRIEIVPRALPENGGGGCGYWSPTDVTRGTAGVLLGTCADDDGDVMTATIVTGPKHGLASQPLVTQMPYGAQNMTVAYVPEPGYEGYDCVEVRMTDGNGLKFTLTFDIWVRPVPVPIDLPPLPLPTLPTLPQLPETGAPPSTADVRSLVQQVTGTADVKRVERAGDVQVWAPEKLSRTALERTGQAPGLVVLCTARCRIKGDSELALGSRAVRASRTRSVAALEPGQPHVVRLTLKRAERRALRRARKPQGRFKLSLRLDGAPPLSIKRAIPIRG